MGIWTKIDSDKCRINSYEDFCHIYDKYSPVLYSFVYDLCRSKVDAEEIVQDTFLKLWIKRDIINPNKSVKNLLFTIAKNRFIDIFRRRMSDPNFVDYIEHCSLTPEGDDDCNALDFDKFKAQLTKAKEQLSPRQREIFELSKEQGYSSAEIAKKLNISEQVVYNQTSTATKKLREIMGQYQALFSIFFF